MPENRRIILHVWPFIVGKKYDEPMQGVEQPISRETHLRVGCDWGSTGLTAPFINHEEKDVHEC